MSRRRLAAPNLAFGCQVETLVGEVAQALPNAAKAAQAAPAGGGAPGPADLPSFREMRQLLLAQGGPQNLSSQVGQHLVFLT